MWLVSHHPRVYQAREATRPARHDGSPPKSAPTQLLASPSGLTRIADRLEQRGLIARETPRDNRRVVRVTLTERGNEVLAEADRAFGQVLRESFSEALSEEEVAWLRRILRKLLERNGAWAAAR